MDAENDPIEYLWKAADDAGPEQRLLALGKEPGPPGRSRVYKRSISWPATAGVDTGTNASTCKSAAGCRLLGARHDEDDLEPGPKAEVSSQRSQHDHERPGMVPLTTAPAASPERYVLNINHPQYALLSRVHDKASAGELRLDSVSGH